MSLAQKRGNGGFTLIETAIVVVIIAVLAAIAIPVFTSEARSSKSDAETTAMITALSLAEESYKLENGSYLSTGASETDTWPTAPGPAPQALAPHPATWDALKLVSPSDTARCAYVVVAGNPGDPAGAIATADFGYTAPATAPWFYVLARCDQDNDSAKDGYFFKSNADTTIKSINPDN